jgi:hypothetical protein
MTCCRKSSKRFAGRTKKDKIQGEENGSGEAVEHCGITCRLAIDSIRCRPSDELQVSQIPEGKRSRRKVEWTGAERREQIQEVVLDYHRRRVAFFSWLSVYYPACI